MANNDDPLFREVEEELRREQIEKLWEKYGLYLIGAAIAIVLAVGGVKWYQARQLAAAQAAGARYEEALRLFSEGKNEEALKAFESLASGGARGYAILSKLQLAAAKAKAGKTAEAVSEFESLGSGASDPLLGDFARLQAAALRLGEADFTEMQNRLKPLVAEGNPWRASARELLAAAAIKAGRTDEARALLEQVLADRTTPPGLAERVRNMMAGLLAMDRAKTASSSQAEAAKN